MVAVTGGLTSLDLSNNQLCGLDRYGHGAYTAEGITAIADALRVNGALTKLSLAQNKLEEEGTKAICDALEQNKTLKELDISGELVGKSNIGGTAGCKHVAKMLGVNGALTELNLSNNRLCGVWSEYGHHQGKYNAEGINAIADALRVNGALTVTNLLGNQLDAESAKMLAEVAKQEGISLCGIQRDQTTANFCNKSLQPPDAILLASDLSQAVVTGALTTVNLSRNVLCGVDHSGKGTYTAEGITAIADALRVNGGLTSLHLSGNALCGVTPFGRGTYTAEGITAIADALRVNGGLTMLALARNMLGEEGTKAICEALEQNKTLKELDISGEEGIIRGLAGAIGGSAGAKHVAKMLGVNGALTVTNLLNILDAESAKMLAEVAKQKGISLCGIRRDQTTEDDFRDMGLKPPDAILLASDLSQAVVTGALTQVLASCSP